MGRRPPGKRPDAPAWAQYALRPGRCGTGGHRHFGQRRHPPRRDEDEEAGELRPGDGCQHHRDDPMPLAVLSARPAHWHLGRSGLVEAGSEERIPLSAAAMYTNHRRRPEGIRAGHGGAVAPMDRRRPRQRADLGSDGGHDRVEAAGCLP